MKIEEGCSVQPTRGSGERRQFPQPGQGRGPGRKRLLIIFWVSQNALGEKKMQCVCLIWQQYWQLQLQRYAEIVLKISEMSICACELIFVIVGHINRFFLLTYLLTYLLTPLNTALREWDRQRHMQTDRRCDFLYWRQHNNLKKQLIPKLLVLRKWWIDHICETAD